MDRRSWFLAKVLVVLTLALTYYLAIAPLAAVYVANVGMPFLLARFLIWTPGILLVCVAVGTLIGVLFIGRSVAPPVATGVGVLSCRGETLIDKTRIPKLAGLAPSTALTVKPYLPTTFGVPEMTPVDGFKPRPGGMDPEITE